MTDGQTMAIQTQYLTNYFLKIKGCIPALLRKIDDSIFANDKIQTSRKKFDFWKMCICCYEHGIFLTYKGFLIV